MNKIIIIIISTIFIFSNSLYSQKISNRISGNKILTTIIFDEPKYIDKNIGKVTQRDYWEYSDIDEQYIFKIPTYHFIFALPQKEVPKINLLSKDEVKLENTVPKLLPKYQLKNDSSIVAVDNNEINKIVVDNSLDYEVVKYFWFQGYYCIELKINSHKFNYNENQITQINKIELEFVFKENLQKNKIQEKNNSNEILIKTIKNSELLPFFYKNIKTDVVDSTSKWINFDKPYIKINVCQDGLHRIYTQTFINNNLQTNSIDPRTFRIIINGIEQKIFVSGENDGAFDENDYIEFVVSKNYNKKSYRNINGLDEEYNELLNRYTDTNSYFLTWDGALGKRVDVKNNNFSPGIDTLDYYSFLLHSEENTMFQNCYNDEIINQMPNWNNNKTWYWSWLFNTPRNFSFKIEKPSEYGKLRIYVKLVSAASNITTDAHQVLLLFNNNIIDSVYSDRFKQILLKGDVNQGNFSEGTNTFTLKNLANGSSPNQIALDWYEIEYGKLLDLENGRLLFRIPENISLGKKLVKVSNALNKNYVVYKTFPSIYKISNISIENNELYFVDSLQTGDIYYLIEEDSIKTTTKLDKIILSNLRNFETPIDYIAITSKKFNNAVKSYLDYIESEFKIKTTMVNVEDIYNEFGYGFPTPYAIREFLRLSNYYWSEPKAKYVVLFGDANYDYKDYILKNYNVHLSNNIIPSYGNPISDYWYTIWDSNSYPLPQIIIGRIPINTEEDLTNYLNKIKNYQTSKYDYWNKNYLFFSGGNINNIGELQSLRNSNDGIINKFILSSPIYGNYSHFYKTTSPQTEYGPISTEAFQNKIDSGGVFISYLGHSGTSTWDNGINNIMQLNNKFNKNSFITDFGCSTNKFGEPDIICFGEKFILNQNSQAIGYLGNSSLGFLSTSTNLPNYFYESIFADTNHQVGSAHYNSKYMLYERLGGSNVNLISSLTNCLLGDPIVNLRIPNKPNIKVEHIAIDNIQYITDMSDSIEIPIKIINQGISVKDSLEILIEQVYQSHKIFSVKYKIAFPNYYSILRKRFFVKGLAGKHNIVVSADYSHKINEIYEDDNIENYEFNVAASNLRDLISDNISNGKITELKILNPSIYSSKSFNIKYQISENEKFINFGEFVQKSDSLTTTLSFSKVNSESRKWFRYKIDNYNESYSINKSFSSLNNLKFYIGDSLSVSNQNLNFVNTIDEKTTLSNKLNSIYVLSSGYYSGGTCVIQKNGENLLSNSFFAGMGIAVLDSSTFNVEYANWFYLFGNQANADSLTKIIENVPTGKIVIMGIADDGQNKLNSNLKAAIKTLGSTKIDSVIFRSSWSLIGIKNVPGWNVSEIYKGPYDGQAIIDTIVNSISSYGSLKTNVIGPSSNWKKLVVDESHANNSKITFKPILISANDNTEDTLNTLNFTNNEASLNFIDAKKYPNIKILTEFTAGDNNTSPILNSFGVDYTGIPELAINYQVVSVEKDTVDQGENADLRFYVYNVGESKADSVKVIVEVINADNSREKIFEQTIKSLDSEKRMKFNLSYNTSNSIGAKTFSISIDPENKIDELYEDNNYFNYSFFVKGDSTKPSLALTFDGNQIFDGEYIAKEPSIKIELNDPSLVPISDTTAVAVFLNNKYISYFSNPEILKINYSSTNPKVTVNYNPILEDGEYTLKVLGRDASGNIDQTSGITRNFNVMSEPKLLEVYNYPNPFGSETYFTFKLTQIPDEINIKVFTVAGRLIKEFELSSNQLNYDLNKIYWDGKDKDGDMIGNGVYLYKVIMDVDGKKQDVTQKLAVVR